MVQAREQVGGGEVGGGGGEEGLLQHQGLIHVVSLTHHGLLLDTLIDTPQHLTVHLRPAHRADKLLLGYFLVVGVELLVESNDGADYVVTTCIVLDEFDEGLPNMINSDLLVDSLDNDDDEEDDND